MSIVTKILAKTFTYVLKATIKSIANEIEKDELKVKHLDSHDAYNAISDKFLKERGQLARKQEKLQVKQDALRKKRTESINAENEAKRSLITEIKTIKQSSVEKAAKLENLNKLL